MFREMLRIKAVFFEKILRNLAKTPCSDCSMGRGGNTGVRTGGKKAASNAKRYPLCENRRIPFTRNPPVSCLLGRCPNPLRTQKLCSGTMDKSIGCAIFKSLVGGQLSAAPPLFPVVHSLPPVPCPVSEYGRYWLWPSAALSFPHGLFGSQCRRLSSPPAARRTRYSAP